MLRPRVIKRIGWIAAAVIVALALAWWLTRSRPVTVSVATLARGTVESIVANTRAGTVTACRRSKLSPAMGGQIERLPVTKGEQVHKGQVLLELWNEDLKAQLQLARDEARVASAQERSACLEADNAAREAARQRRLRKNEMVSVEQLDQAMTRANTTAARCTAAKAGTEEAQSRVNLAQANLERTILTAPFDGIVADINGELDEYVTPSPPGIPTLPVIDLIDNSCYYVEAPIDEVDAAKVRVGMPVRVTLDAFGKRSFQGAVSRIGAYVIELEKQARTVDVDVKFSPDTDIHQLLAGYSADVEILLDRKTDVVRVPTESVVNGDEVYVYDPETRRLKLTRFKPGISNWTWTQAVSGLKAGERVVTSVDRKGVGNGVRVAIERHAREP